MKTRRQNPKDNKHSKTNRKQKQTIRGPNISKKSSKKLTKLDNLLCKLYESQSGKSQGKNELNKNVNEVVKNDDHDDEKSGESCIEEHKSQVKSIEKKTSKVKAKEVVEKTKIKDKKPTKSTLMYKDRSSEYIKINDREYKCAQCDFTHSNLVSIRGHYDKEHNQQTFKCELCPFKTRQQYYFNSHIRHHSRPDMECPHCKKMIKWFSYKMHIKTHERNNKTEYKCEYCEYHSYNHANVKRHTLTRHKNPHELKTYSCDSCDYITVLEERLKQHKKVVHTKEGVWQTCPQCEYTTRNKAHLARHINDLHNEKSVQCPECQQLFSSKDHLRYHKQRRHTDQSQKTYYYCDMCPKERQYKTTEKANLARHALAHRTLDEIEVFACHKCPYLAKFRSALKTHLINAHFPEMHSFKCKICGYSTNTKSRYNVHIKDVHGKPKKCNELEKQNQCDEQTTDIFDMSYNELAIKEEYEDSSDYDGEENDSDEEFMDSNSK
ncbi:hypothetical protein ABEB36_007042 [Hypothenemus hampei]|uniref:C2H2-type domain-containing protein n=1 Tax=Hypothenemus hampei TaxID=57062 RepID=A0ABD1EUV1_HYPHA